jgi:hypothetical protein
MIAAPDPGIGPALGDAGAHPTVTLDGKTWTVGHPTQKAKSELELFVIAAAKKNLADLRPTMSEAEWVQEQEELRLQLYGRAWQTWGKLWAALTNGPLGDALFLASLLKDQHPEVTLDAAERLWLGANDDCRLALSIVVPDFFALLVMYLPANETSKRALAERMRAEVTARLARPTLTA